MRHILWLFILLHLCSYSYGQRCSHDSTGTHTLYHLQGMNGVYKFSDELIIPADTFKTTCWPSYGSIAMQDGLFYFFDGVAYVTPTAAGSGITFLGTSAPLTGGPVTTTGTIGITQASSIQAGYLSSVDWNTFNTKLSRSDSNTIFLTPFDTTNKWIPIGTPLGNTYTASGYLGQSGFSFYLDTAAFKAATKTNLLLKVNYTDTSGMLSYLMPKWDSGVNGGYQSYFLAWHKGDSNTHANPITLDYFNSHTGSIPTFTQVLNSGNTTGGHNISVTSGDVITGTGDIPITAPNGVSGSRIDLTSGNGSAGFGGDINVISGDGTSGGGTIYLVTGSTTASGAGASLWLEASNGVGGNNNGGDITMILGNKAGSGRVGEIIIQPNSVAFTWAFDYSALASSNKTIKWSNESGTPLLTIDSNLFVPQYRLDSGILNTRNFDYSTFTPLTRSLTINGSTQTLASDRTWTVTDANLSVSDIITNNASTSQHGFLKKLSNVATQYMDGTGSWSTPSGTVYTAGRGLGLATAQFYADTTVLVKNVVLKSDGVVYASPMVGVNTLGIDTITLTRNTQTANVVYAGPTSGGAALPTFRALVVADIPTLSYQPTGSYVTYSDTTVAAAYTLTSRDLFRRLHCTNGTNIAITIPTGLGATFQCEIIQEGAGTVTPTTSGTTFTFVPTGTKTNGGAVSVQMTSTTDKLLIQGSIQ